LRHPFIWDLFEFILPQYVDTSNMESAIGLLNSKIGINASTARRGQSGFNFAQYKICEVRAVYQAILGSLAIFTLFCTVPESGLILLSMIYWIELL